MYIHKHLFQLEAIQVCRSHADFYSDLIFICISDFCKEANLQIFILLRVGFAKNLQRIQKKKKKKDPDGRQKSLHLVSIGRIEQAGFFNKRFSFYVIHVEEISI